MNDKIEKNIKKKTFTKNWYISTYVKKIQLFDWVE